MRRIFSSDEIQFIYSFMISACFSCPQNLYYKLQKDSLIFSSGSAIVLTFMFGSKNDLQFLLTLFVCCFFVVLYFYEYLVVPVWFVKRTFSIDLTWHLCQKSCYNIVLVKILYYNLLIYSPRLIPITHCSVYYRFIICLKFR